MSEPGLTAASVTLQQHYESLLRQGLELYGKGWYGPAMGRFRNAARVMPLSATPHLWMARSAYKAGHYQEARQAVGRVLAIAPASQAGRDARALMELIRRVTKPIAGS